ncbi:MAG TPA: 30S ribosomal protein S16 [bacterium]
MVVIRLQRRGTKKVYHHRIVVTERAHAQSSRVLEILGYYDPAKEPEKFALDESRFVYWLSCGARVSEAVARLVRRYKRISVSSAKA